MKSKTFPKGYKQYRILKKMNEDGGMRYTDIVKLAYEISHGKDSFDSHWNRGYWSGVFIKIRKKGRPWGPTVNGWVTRLCNYTKERKYVLNYEGKMTLIRLEKKFGDLVFLERGTTLNPCEEVSSGKSKSAIIEIPKQGKAAVDQIVTRSFIQPDNKGSFHIVPSVTKFTDQPKFVMNVGEFKIDDEVLFYRTGSKSLGEGYISTLKIFSKKLLNHSPEITVDYGHGTIQGIKLVGNKFYEVGGNEIILQKK